MKKLFFFNGFRIQFDDERVVWPFYEHLIGFHKYYADVCDGTSESFKFLCLSGYNSIAFPSLCMIWVLDTIVIDANQTGSIKHLFAAVQLKRLLQFEWFDPSVDLTKSKRAKKKRTFHLIRNAITAGLCI